jgi:glycosyltransferase 2 family protein
MKVVWRLALLGVGLSVFGWYLSRVGLDQVWAAMKRLGGFAPLILLPYLLVYFVDCLAWVQTLPPRGIPFLRLLRVRWAGESVNNLVPSALVGGEAVKVCLLRAQGFAAAEGATSAILSKTAQTLAQMVFVFTAAIILLEFVQGQPARFGVLVIVLGGLSAVTVLFWVQRFGVFRALLWLAKALPKRYQLPPESQSQWLEVDQTILGFYRSQPRRFYRSTALYLCGWLLDCLEIYLVAHLLGVPITWTQALVVEGFTGMAKALGMWVPGSLGVQESGIVLMGRMVGLPDTFCATYALLRRARELIFAATGLAFLYADRTLRVTAGAGRSEPITKCTPSCM